jgi:hypothetical protein
VFAIGVSLPGHPEHDVFVRLTSHGPGVITYRGQSIVIAPELARAIGDGVEKAGERHGHYNQSWFDEMDLKLYFENMPASPNMSDVEYMATTPPASPIVAPRTPPNTPERPSLAFMSLPKPAALTD